MKRVFACAIAQLPCYDGEETESKTFSEADVNKIVEERLARDRRNRETAYQQLESKYQELLGSQNLNTEERTRLEGTLSDIQKQLRTKEEQARLDLQNAEKQAKERVTSIEQERDSWRERYTKQTIERTILDAAMQNEAFNPNQIVNLLKGSTRLVEKVDDSGKTTGQYEVMVDLADKQLSVGDAVKQMKGATADYGNLFKSGVVPGLGTQAGNGGLTPGANGRVDITKLSDAEYDRIRKENPALIGLK